MIESRTHDLERFYTLLSSLDNLLGGARTLSQCDGRMGWPLRGVYFFQELGELRTDTGMGLRIVRVGTHALKSGSGTKLWTVNGGGNAYVWSIQHSTSTVHAPRVETRCSCE